MNYFVLCVKLWIVKEGCVRGLFETGHGYRFESALKKYLPSLEKY